MKRWEYALRQAIGFEPTSTSFLSFNKPKSTKNRSVSRTSSSGDVLVPVTKKPSSSGDSEMNPRTSTAANTNNKSSIVIASVSNDISDFF